MYACRNAELPQVKNTIPIDLACRWMGYILLFYCWIRWICSWPEQYSQRMAAQARPRPRLEPPVGTRRRAAQARPRMARLRPQMTRVRPRSSLHLGPPVGMRGGPWRRCALFTVQSDVWWSDKPTKWWYFGNIMNVWWLCCLYSFLQYLT